MIRVVIDTNVIVSGFYNLLSGPPGEVLLLTVFKKTTPCFDARIMFEYQHVCKRPAFRFNPEMLNETLGFIETHGIKVAPDPVPVKVRDITDMPFIQTSVFIMADFLNRLKPELIYSEAG